MGRLLGTVRLPDSAQAALVVGGIAIALGGAALFAIVVHTRTPWSTQRIVGLVPLDSLSPVEFVVPKSEEFKRPLHKTVPAEPPPAQTQIAAAPAVMGPPAPPDSLSQGESVVAPPETRIAEVKPLELPPMLVALERIEFSRLVPAMVPMKITVAKRAEAKRVEAKRVESKPGKTKLAAQKPAQAKRFETKPVVLKSKAAEPKRFKSIPAGLKLVSVKHFEPRPAAPRIAEAKRIAELNEKRVAELKAEEEKLAQARRAGEQQAAEAKLADAKRAAEIQAAEAKLAATKRAVETTLAEAKLAQAKLAETSQRAEVRPAVETRPAALCDVCGIVTSVSRRGGSGFEVRVRFGTGSNWTFLYPSDPGFSYGDRVRVQAGRITRM